MFLELFWCENGPRIYVFIMGYVTLTIGSLAGALVYIVRCLHLYSFESHVRPFALRIKYPVTKG